MTKFAEKLARLGHYATAVSSTGQKRRRDSIIDLTEDDDAVPQPKRPCYMTFSPELLCGQIGPFISDAPCTCGFNLLALSNSFIAFDEGAAQPRPQMQMPQSTQQYRTISNAVQRVAPTMPAVVAEPMPATPTPAAASSPSKRRKRSDEPPPPATPLTPEEQKAVTARHNDFMATQMAALSESKCGSPRELWTKSRDAKKEADRVKRAAERELARAERQSLVESRLIAQRVLQNEEKAEASKRRAAKKGKSAGKAEKPTVDGPVPEPRTVLVSNNFSADATHKGIAGTLTVASNGSWLSWKAPSATSVSIQRQYIDSIKQIGLSKEDAEKHKIILIAIDAKYTFVFGNDSTARQKALQAKEYLQRMVKNTIQPATLEAQTHETQSSAKPEDTHTSFASDNTTERTEDSSDAPEPCSADIYCTCDLPYDQCRCFDEEEEEESADGGELILMSEEQDLERELEIALEQDEEQGEEEVEVEATVGQEVEEQLEEEVQDVAEEFAEADEEAIKEVIEEEDEESDADDDEDENGLYCGPFRR